MTSFLRRLATEEDGTCMTDSRGMYGWTLLAGVAVFYMYGHRFPELVAMLDKALPAANAYHVVR